MGSGPPGHRLAESIPWNRFLGLIKYLKILPLFVFPFLKVLVKNTVILFLQCKALYIAQYFPYIPNPFLEFFTLMFSWKEGYLHFVFSFAVLLL